MTDTVPPKRPEGRAGHLTPDKKLQIRLAYLETGGQRTYKALAEQFNINRDSVSACLKGGEFDALQHAFNQEAQRIAKQHLQSAMVEAAESWRRALPVAAEKGDHRPARDLLLHTGSIEPLAKHEECAVTVLVGGGGIVNIGHPLAGAPRLPGNLVSS
jgi:hypothetical protein